MFTRLTVVLALVLIGLTLGSVAGAFNLNLRLSAMENTGTVRVLSSPRVTTMDNIEARIVQGVSIPVSVVSAMGVPLRGDLQGGFGCRSRRFCCRYSCR